MVERTAQARGQKNDDFFGKVSFKLNRFGKCWEWFKMHEHGQSEFWAMFWLPERRWQNVVIPPFVFPFGFQGSWFDLIYWSCWGVLNVPPEMMGMWNGYVNFRNLIRYPPQSESGQKCHSPKWRHLWDQTLKKQLNQAPVCLMGAVCWTKWYKLLLN